MRICITGGCGFLGSNLAVEALRRSWEVKVLDNLSRKGAYDNLKWLQDNGLDDFDHIDVRQAYRVDSAFESYQPDAVFHVAGQVAMTTSLADPRSDFEINAGGTLNVLEAVRRFCPHAKVLYSSTNKVYGDLLQYSYAEKATRYECDQFPDGFPETVAFDCHSPYGCSKGAADIYMRDYHRMFGLSTMVFRHSSMYGGRQYASVDQGWIGWFCGQAIKQANDSSQSAFTICGNGKQVRDVLHAQDMVRLYFEALQSPASAWGQAYNIGGGVANSLSLIELFNILQDKLQTELKHERLPPRSSDQLVFVADVAQAAQELGWCPEVSVSDGIDQMLAWCRSIE